MAGLPTPPRTSHRDKENVGPSRRAVGWADNQIHWFSPEVHSNEHNSPRKSCEPSKSILKQSKPLEPFTLEKERDLTPQPEDVMANSEYLKWPIDKILAQGSSLRELTEAYSIFNARLRVSITENRSAMAMTDSSLPFFDPLKRHAEQLADAFSRDLQRALTDPMTTSQTPAEVSQLHETRTVGLLSPISPKESPKKQGMSAEQVKYGRDLSILTHTTIRLLSVIFNIPSVNAAFTPEQLSALLTHLLSIPLSPMLPTPNARKTCALAISLIQAQRLPYQILAPAKDRIVYAIRRGIEGELGKEGKKGSANDGLKAVHDLSRHQPALFVAGFASILPSILDCLLAASLVLRASAAHALGGFVLAFTAEFEQHTVSNSLIEGISSVTEDFFMTPRKARKRSPPPTPSSADNSAIVELLRTALGNEEPTNPAQGPVWAISVLASCIVLLGPALFKNTKVVKTVYSLTRVALRSRKVYIKSLASGLPNPVIWVYLHTRPVGVEAKEDGRMGKSHFLDIMPQNEFPYRTGALICALLGDSHEACSDEDMRSALDVLMSLVRYGGQKADFAVKILGHLMASGKDEDEAPTQTCRKSFRSKLMTMPLYSVSPGLLTVDTKALQGHISNLLSLGPNYLDARQFSDEEMAKPLVWDGLMGIWRQMMSCLELEEKEETPRFVAEIWERLVKIKARNASESERELEQAALHLSEILSSILFNSAIDFTPLRTTSDNKSQNTEWKEWTDPVLTFPLKCTVVRNLWDTIAEVFGSNAHVGIGHMLNKLTTTVCGNAPPETPCATHWSMIAAHFVLASNGDIIRDFWGYRWGWTTEKKSFLWRTYCAYWREAGGTWEGAVAILSLPFVDKEPGPWDMSDSDLAEWDALLQYAIMAGFLKDINCSCVLERIAQSIERRHLVTLTCSARVADILLSNIELSAETELQFPHCLVDFVHEIMVMTYPPEPRTKIEALWLIRSLRTFIDGCPLDQVLSLLETIHDGLCIWIADDCDMFSVDEYGKDIMPLYQTILVTLQCLPPSFAVLESLSGIFPSPLRGLLVDMQEPLEAFKEFWEHSYATLTEPADGWPQGIATTLARLREHESLSLRQADNIPNCIEDEVYEADVSLESCPESLSTRDSDDEELYYPESEDEEQPAECHLESSSETSNCVVPQELSSGVVKVQDSVHLRASPKSPATPKKSDAIPVTPNRPAKQPSAAALPSTSVLSPLSPSPSFLARPKTVRRLPRPRDQSKSHDKENAAPGTPPTSSPLRAAPKGTVLGKRNVSSLDHLALESVTKRRKLTNDENFADTGKCQLYPTFTSDSDDARAVEAHLFSIEPTSSAKAVSPKRFLQAHGSNYRPQPPMTGPSDQAEDSEVPVATPTKKRKRMVMDAVVLPTLELVTRQQSETRPTALVPSSPGISKRTRSKVRSVSSMATHMTFVKGHVVQKKAKHGPTKVDGTQTRASLSASENLSLRDKTNQHSDSESDLPGSDDSFTPDSNISSLWTESSSDDSVAIGRVTPRHLISPPPRRLADSEPASDDSVMSSSPTREHVTRRLVRSSSGSSSQFALQAEAGKVIARPLL